MTGRVKVDAASCGRRRLLTTFLILDIVSFSCGRRQVVTGFQFNDKLPIQQLKAFSIWQSSIMHRFDHMTSVTAPFELKMAEGNKNQNQNSDESDMTPIADITKQRETLPSSRNPSFTMDKATLNKIETDADKLDSFIKQIDDEIQVIDLNDRKRFASLLRLQGVAVEKRD